MNADSVFAVNQLMRLPGSYNNKRLNGETPILVTAQLQPGGPLQGAEFDRRLTKAGIEERDDDRAVAGKEISPPADWTFADDYLPARTTCPYVAKMIAAWATDRPKPGGSPTTSCTTGISGCSAHTVRLHHRRRLPAGTADPGRSVDGAGHDLEPRRRPRRFEIAEFNKYGIRLVASETDEQVCGELGNHGHDDANGQAIDAATAAAFFQATSASTSQAATGTTSGTGQSQTTTGAAKIDEAAFWNAYPELTSCRDYARSVRVGPWAMLGGALTLASATIPPYVVLPGIVGDYASVNLYVNLVGPSGAIKSEAIAAARAWLHTVPPPEPVKPGSGQGVAKCFAYVKTTKSGPVQVGKRWTAVAMIPEVDTLTAAGSMTGSSLWAELRSAWSDERVGHDYADATKSVVLQPRRYRLCMIVGVQPLRAGPIFDDVDAGTPQRFVWLPVDDPGAPNSGPPTAPAGAARVGTKTGRTPATPSSTSSTTIDQKLADQLDKPSTATTLRVLKIPPEATEAIDAVARGKLRSETPVSTRSTGTGCCAS